MSVTSLNKRRNDVLEALVSLHIKTAKPVSSGLIKKRYDFPVSTATIRSVMAELEDMGYIHQPHTSSGRVPTDKGYRLYIDTLMREEKLLPDFRRQLRDQYLNISRQVEDVISQASNVLSNLCYEAGLNMFFDLKESSLRFIDIIKVAPDRILVVLITDTGIVRNYYLYDEAEYAQDALRRVSNFINENLKGTTLSELKNRLTSMQSSDKTPDEALAQDALDILESIDLELLLEKEIEIMHNGLNYVLGQPEFEDINKARTLINIIEDKNVMAEVLKGHLAPQQTALKITVGSENELEGMRECSLITANYRIGDRTAGMLGLLGPTRMPYSRIKPLMEYIAALLSDMLTLNAADKTEKRD